MRQSQVLYRALARSPRTQGRSQNAAALPRSAHQMESCRAPSRGRLLAAPHVRAAVQLPVPGDREGTAASENKTSRPQPLLLIFIGVVTEPLWNSFSSSVKWLEVRIQGRKCQQPDCLIYTACHSAPPASSPPPGLKQNLYGFGLPFRICAVSPAGMQALGGWLPISAKTRVKPPGSVWPSKTHILPLPVAAHVGVLGVQGEDDLQEGADDESCH